MALGDGAMLHAIVSSAGIGEAAVFGVWDAYGALSLPFAEVGSLDADAGIMRLTSEDDDLFYIEIRRAEESLWSGELAAGSHLAAWLRAFYAGSFSIKHRPFRSWTFDPADGGPSLRLHRARA